MVRYLTGYGFRFNRLTGFLPVNQICTNFEGVIFKLGVFRRMMKITPIDSSRRELLIRFLSVSNGYELRFLRSSQVDVFFNRLITG